MEHKQFDEHMRRVLSGLDARPDPARWELMSRRLDLDDAEHPDPDETAVDALLRRKLQGLEASPFPQSDWSGLEARIAASEQADDREADELLRDRLQRMLASYQPSHWQLMTRRIEEEFSLWYRFRRYRVAEATLTLLLLLTCFRFAPWGNYPWSLPHLRNTLESFAQHILSAERQSLASLPAAAAVTTATPVPAARPTDAGPDTAGQPIPTAEPDIRYMDPPGPTASGHGPEPVERLATLPIAVRQPKESQARLQSPNSRPFPAGNDRSVPPTAHLPLMPQRFAAALFGPKQAPPLLPQRRQKQRQTRFSLLTSSDISYVFSPSNQLNVFDTLVPTPSATTLASGYGGGILVSWKIDRWEFQTGGLYSFKRYIPNTPVFFFETVNYYIREEFRGVQLDLLQLPVSLQYHVKNAGNWRFYGAFGASGYLVTSSVYEIDHQRTLAVKVPTGPPAAEEALLEDDASIRTEQDLPDGLVDGGLLRNNFYLTANLGIGVERYVTPRWTLFVQPEYQHFLHAEGIGVNRERFYTLSFRMGTKVSLK